MSEDGAPKTRAWQRMLSGRRLDLLSPSPHDIDIGDIAHGLARLARWNGQTRGRHAFSVAQHSLLVERIVGEIEPGCEARVRLAALLHDAPEYVIGDLISPFKAAIGLDYKAFERRLERAIFSRFGLDDDLIQKSQKLIKTADRAAAYFESVRLAGFSLNEAEDFFGPVPELSARSTAAFSRLRSKPPWRAEAEFLSQAQLLMSVRISVS